MRHVGGIHVDLHGALERHVARRRYIGESREGPDAEGSGGEPEIRVSLARRGGDVVLSVADSGPGVPDDKREEVVKRFVRLDASRSKPGTGLGLSLVGAVMEMHHGRLELDATHPGRENNRGLTVRMVFPVLPD